MRRKIALHGFGSTPIVFKYLIELAAKDGAPIDWCMILPTPEHRALVRSILPSSDILDVYEALPRPPVGGDLSLLAGYPGSLAEDLGADKRPWGAQDGRKRFARGMDYHLLYKKFLIERGATHFLVPQIEGAEGKIAVATARQLGLSVMVPIDCRSLTGTFFATDAYAGLPAHATPREDLLPKAAEFIERFRKSAMPAHCPPSDFAPIDGDDELVYNDLPSTPARFVGLLRKAAERPDLFVPDQIRASVLNNLPVSEGQMVGPEDISGSARVRRRRSRGSAETIYFLSNASDAGGFDQHAGAVLRRPDASNRRAPIGHAAGLCPRRQRA